MRRRGLLLLAWLGLWSSVAVVAQVSHLRYVPATCVGTNVTTATTNLQSVVDAHPGTVLCFAAGTYLPSGSVHAASGTTFWGAAGAIWDGQSALTRAIYGTGGEIGAGGDPSVTIRGIEFKNYTGTAIDGGWHWVVRGNAIHHNLIGTSLNSYSLLDSNRIYSNGQYGIVGGPGTDILVLNNEVDHNNTGVGCPAGVCDTGDSGASKIVGSTTGSYGLLWRNNYVHDNTGMGIWSDGNVRGTYENNTAANNSGGGIFLEINWDSIVRNNTVTDNASVAIGLSCFWGSQIHLNNSSNVQVYGNTVTASNGANGICAVHANRGDSAPYPVFPNALINLTVHNNAIYMNGAGNSGVVQDMGAVNSTNSYTVNAYHVSSLTGTFWTWPSAAANPATFAQWQSASQDTGGSQVIWP